MWMELALIFAFGLMVTGIVALAVYQEHINERIAARRSARELRIVGRSDGNAEAA